MGIFDRGQKTGEANKAITRTEELNILETSDAELNRKNSQGELIHTNDEIARGLAVTDKNGKRIHSNLPLDGEGGLRTLPREKLLEEVHVAQVAQGVVFFKDNSTLNDKKLKEFGADVLIRGIEQGHLSDKNHEQLSAMDPKKLIKIISDKQASQSMMDGFGSNGSGFEASFKF